MLTIDTSPVPGLGQKAWRGPGIIFGKGTPQTSLEKDVGTESLVLHLGFWLPLEFHEGDSVTLGLVFVSDER